MSSRASDASRTTTNALFFLLMLGWVALSGWGIWTGRLPMLALLVALLLNIAVFFVYWFDKNAAQSGRWRTRESTLHWLSLLGGWPGAWFAQKVLRHKSRKQTFRTSYWVTVILHFALLAAWLSRLSIQSWLFKP